MNTESYEITLKNLDWQISEMENKIRSIQGEIREAEQAKESSKGIKNDFDYFVSREKQKNSRDTRGRLVKSFSSFINKVSDLLSGHEYTQASEKIEEIGRILNTKLRTLYEDLEYCKQELYRLKDQRETAYASYRALLNSSNKGE